jgi:glucoamylase
MSHAAPGAPGSSPKWTSTDKNGAGTALWSSSQVWFTISHGILNEVYFPGVDVACVRDVGLIVTDGRDFFSEEKRDAISTVELEGEGVPAYRLTNRCRQGRYVLSKRIVTDPRRNVLLQHTRFVGEGLRLHLLVAPHIGNSGSDNHAWVGEYRGVRMLFARRGDLALAVGCSVPWVACSVGFVGVSDGWQDLTRHKRLTWAYDRADNGNVALTGEIDGAAAGEGVVLAFGFGRTPEEAGMRVQHSFLDGFEAAWRSYVIGWKQLQESLVALPPRPTDLYRVSVAMLRVHEDKRFPGGIIPSLSIPWGFEKGSTELGDYHQVWPRDLALAAGALVAAGAKAEAMRVLHYLLATQEADGHWSQSLTPDGRPQWTTGQMDEPALVILLVDLARREGLLDENGEMRRVWPMVRRAASFVVKNGPVMQEDRTDRDPGFSPYTLAAAIAALLAVADMADELGEDFGRYLRETADIWNDGIDQWTWLSSTDLARWVDVEGYYARIAGPDEAPFSNPRPGLDPARLHGAPEAVVTPDALGLVRFGVRAADDPRIEDTVRVIDDVLKVDTPVGPSWHRMADDRYGEYDDGSVYDGGGVGRAWPLLTGERAHYELAAGRREAAEALLEAMEAFANDGGMLPEQVWDADDIEEAGLVFGRPTGSAMPFTWAHAEYVKLRRSLHEGRVFDMPPQTVQRYQREKAVSSRVSWRFNHKTTSVAPGLAVRIETLAAAEVHWSIDGWATMTVSLSADSGIGLHYLDLPPLAEGDQLEFTFYWPQARHFEGRQFTIRCLVE